MLINSGMVYEFFGTYVLQYHLDGKDEDDKKGEAKNKKPERS